MLNTGRYLLDAINTSLRHGYGWNYNRDTQFIFGMFQAELAETLRKSR